MKAAFRIKRKIKGILPKPVLAGYYFAVPFIGQLAHGRPSRKLNLVGVTGTDGKSSTVFFLAKILQIAGFKTGFSSSVFFGDGDKIYDNTLKMTMPGRWFFAEFLHRLAKNACQFAVLEVTSEGVKQQRHVLMDFDAALITNLQPEHIESHRGFENYKKAKQVIFKNLTASFRKGFPKTIIANADDGYADEFLKFPADKKVTFGFIRPADVKGELISSDFYHNSLKATSQNQDFAINSNMGGPFAAANLLAASAAGLVFGVSADVIKLALEQVTLVPGRFEIVSKDPLIIVDYAHTIQALEKLLPYVRSRWPGKIIHVFGAAGGGRDRWKRPLLAKLSQKYSDFTILTEENSFDEPIGLILDDIAVGFSSFDRVIRINSRHEAIGRALEIQKQAEQGALVLITGKGCEKVIAGPQGEKFPHNDKKSVLWHLGNP